MANEEQRSDELPLFSCVSYEAVEALERKDCMKTPQNHSILKLVFWIFVLIALISIVIGLVMAGLVGVWYYYPPCSNGSNVSDISPIGYITIPGYIFVTLVHWLCKYPAFLYGLWKLLNTQSISYNAMKIVLNKWITRKNAAARAILFFLTISAICVLFTTSTIFGVKVEIPFSCGPRSVNMFYAKKAFSCIDCLCSILIMIIMAFATLAVSEIWTSTAESEDLSLTVEFPHEVRDPQSILNAAVFTANHHHATLSILYKNAGEKIKPIKDIFRYYFPLPWITFFILSAIQGQVKLFANKQHHQDISEDNVYQRIGYVVLYYLYLFIQLITLYVLAVSMNQSHAQFLEVLRKKQLQTCDIEKERLLNMEEAESRFTKACHGYARNLRIEKDEDYDFVPRILFLGIEVHMNNSAFVIFLLIGGILTVTGTFL